MLYALLIIFSTAHGPVITSARYSSVETCRRDARAVQTRGRRVVARCIQIADDR